MALAHSDDASLQRWGRDLSLVGPALAELNQHYIRVSDADKSTAIAVSKMAQQGDTDLPVAPPLAAEVESIAAELRRIAADQGALNARRQKLTGQAETLPTTYRREHETDEDRLTAPRRSRAAERRADVSAAEQDT